MASLSSSSSSENAATSSTKSTNDDYADLSPYEIARLKQIEQNKRKLLELGLTTLAPKKRPAKEKTEGGKTAESERKRKKQVFQKEERAKRQKMLASPSMGSRRSSRLAYVAAAQGGGLKHDDDEGREDGHSTEEEEVSVDDTIHYDRMPMDPDELDDYEFEVYAAVRKWRLVRKRELGKFIQHMGICPPRHSLSDFHTHLS